MCAHRVFRTNLFDVKEIILRSDLAQRHDFDTICLTGVTAKCLHTRDPKPQKQKVKLKRKPKEKYLCALQHPKAVKAPAKSQVKKE